MIIIALQFLTSILVRICLIRQYQLQVSRPNIQLGYGASRTNFLWSTGATTAATTVNPPGGTTNYSVVVTNNLGCTASNSIKCYFITVTQAYHRR